MDGFVGFTKRHEYIAFPDGTKITFSNIYIFCFKGVSAVYGEGFCQIG